MKTKALFLLLLLSLAGVAQAETSLFDIRFSDGRECHKCTYETKQGFLISVKDAKGEEWVDPSKPMEFDVCKSGFWTWTSHTYTSPAGAPPKPVEPASSGPSAGQIVLHGLAAGAAAYASTPRPVYVQPAVTNPTHTNCYTMGNQLNCNSY